MVEHSYYIRRNVRVVTLAAGRDICYPRRSARSNCNVPQLASTFYQNQIYQVSATLSIEELRPKIT